MIKEMREVAGYSGFFITEDGDVYDSKGIQRKVYLSGKPEYKYVNMPDKKGTGGWQIKRVHILVAQTYVPNVEGFKFVDHIDKDKMNNHYSNLRWVTRGQNARNTVNNVYVDYLGESRLLVDVIQEIYSETKPHYCHVWQSMSKGISLTEALKLNDKLRAKQKALG